MSCKYWLWYGKSKFPNLWKIGKVFFVSKTIEQNENLFQDFILSHRLIRIKLQLPYRILLRSLTGVTFNKFQFPLRFLSDSKRLWAVAFGGVMLTIIIHHCHEKRIGNKIWWSLRITVIAFSGALKRFLISETQHYKFTLRTLNDLFFLFVIL